jgi:LysR family transcriptional regulator, low CO2-responsive transcriptional regulator
MAGLGLAILSAHTITAELASGRLATLDLPGLPIVRKWFLVRRSDAMLSAVAERTRLFVLKLEGSFLPGRSDES